MLRRWLIWSQPLKTPVLMINESAMLSIVIPVYNVEGYIADCLDSLLALGTEVEIIAINDGSTDNSLSIVQGYCAGHNNIKVYSQPNGGLSAARNAGLKRVTGDYVYFIDSDDIANASAIMAAYQYARAESLDIVQCQVEVFEDGHFNRRELFRVAYDRQHCQVLNGGEYFLRHVKSGEFPITVFSNIYKTALLIENELEFCVGIIHEDVEWVPRVFIVAERTSFYDAAICYYRRRAGSITNADAQLGNPRSLGSLLVILERHSDMLFAMRHLQKSRAFWILWIEKTYIDAMKQAEKVYVNQRSSEVGIKKMHRLVRGSLGLNYYKPRLMKRRRRLLRAIES